MRYDAKPNHFENRNTFSWVDIILIPIWIEKAEMNRYTEEQTHLLACLLYETMNVCKQAGKRTRSVRLVWAKIIIIECEKWVEAHIIHA